MQMHASGASVRDIRAANEKKWSVVPNAHAHAAASGEMTRDLGFPNPEPRP